MEGLPAGAVSFGPPPRGGAQNGLSNITGVGAVGGGPFDGQTGGIGNPGVPYPTALSYKPTNVPGFSTNETIPHHYVCVSSPAYSSETIAYMNNIKVGDYVFAFKPTSPTSSVHKGHNDIIAMNFHDVNNFLLDHAQDGDLDLNTKTAEEIASMFPFLGVMKNEMNNSRGGHPGMQRLSTRWGGSPPRPPFSARAGVVPPAHVDCILRLRLNTGRST